MKVAVSRYSTMIACDAPGCASRFPTGSIRSLARPQARDAGWGRFPPWALAVEDSPRRRLDACPLHVSEALAAIQSRAELRAQQRAERDRRRQERAARREQRRAERELRAQERAAAFCEHCGNHRNNFHAAGCPLAEDVAPVVREDRPRREGPSNLDVVEKILRARACAMTVGEIVEAAVGELALPTRSRTPRTAVGRDLAIDVRDRGESSRFARVAPGTFALRQLEGASEVL